MIGPYFLIITASIRIEPWIIIVLIIFTWCWFIHHIREINISINKIHKFLKAEAERLHREKQREKEGVSANRQEEINKFLKAEAERLHREKQREAERKGRGIC